MANILMVVSAADSLTMKDGSEHPTGFWAEELVVAHQTLLGAGHTVHLATPGGAKPTVDQVSLAAESAGGEDRAEGFRDYLASIGGELSNPLVLADVDPSAYDAVVMPGGHGPMADLYKDADLGRLLTAADKAGKVKALGLSQVSVEELEAAGNHFTVSTVQNRYNLTDRSSEDVLRYSEENGIGFIPWAPISAGELARRGGPLDEAAKRLGATTSQVALAWLLRRSPVMMPIPGTGSVKHLEENLAAAGVSLDEDTYAELEAAAG